MQLASNPDTQCSQAPDSRVVQAFVLILAGYETTANALAFAIYLLSTNPAKRERLLAEVDAFGRDRVPTLRDLDRRARHKVSGLLGLTLSHPARSRQARPSWCFQRREEERVT